MYLSVHIFFKNMNEKAWKTLEGMYDLIYNSYGMAFQTPEALAKPNTYRSLGYMRPLCIWSIQYSIDNLLEKNLTKAEP